LRTERTWPIWLNASALLLVSWIAVASLALRLPATSETAAVVFPPWWTAAQAIAAIASADAAVVRTGIVPTILIVQLTKPGGLKRLRATGAWFILNPQAVGGCFTT